MEKRRVTSRCPQCGSSHCSPIACRFSGLKHGKPRATPPLDHHDDNDRRQPWEENLGNGDMTTGGAPLKPGS